MVTSTCVRNFNFRGPTILKLLHFYLRMREFPFFLHHTKFIMESSKLLLEIKKSVPEAS